MATTPEPNGVKTSHDLADALRKLADRLTSAEPFNIDSQPRLHLHQYDKPNFIAAAKAIGGVKGGDYFFTLTQNIGALRIETSIYRENVCRLVEPARPAVYEECDPLFEIGDAHV